MEMLVIKLHVINEVLSYNILSILEFICSVKKCIGINTDNCSEWILSANIIYLNQFIC